MNPQSLDHALAATGLKSPGIMNFNDPDRGFFFLLGAADLYPGGRALHRRGNDRPDAEVVVEKINAAKGLDSGASLLRKGTSINVSGVHVEVTAPIVSPVVQVKPEYKLHIIADLESCAEHLAQRAELAGMLGIELDTEHSTAMFAKRLTTLRGDDRLAEDGLDAVLTAELGDISRVVDLSAVEVLQTPFVGNPAPRHTTYMFGSYRW